MEGTTGLLTGAPGAAWRGARALAPSGQTLAASGLGLVLLVVLLLPGIELFETSLQPFPSFDRYERVFDPAGPYRDVILDTFEIAALATLLTAAIGLPFAYYMSLRTGWKRNLALLVLIVPFFTGILVKNFAWTVILQNNGPVNDVLRTLHLGETKLLFTRTAVLLGMTHYLLPLFVLPVFAGLIKIDPRLALAARSLGAGRFATFWLVTIRLARSGLVTGTIVVFIVSLGFYVTPAMLGGRGNLMAANVIDVSVRRLADFEFGAAMAGVLTVIVVALLPIALRYVRPEASTSESLVARTAAKGGA